MNSKILVVAVVTVVIVIVSVFLFVNKSGVTNDTTTGQNTNSNSQTSTGQNTNDSSPQTNTQNSTTEVTLTGAGYSPSEIKIKAGSTVIWANKSGKEATVNSDPHPTHFLWPFLNLGNFADGQNFSVKFEKSGVYTYHNHFDPNHKGKVIVE